MKKILKITGYFIVAVIFAVALSGCSLTKKKTTTDPNANTLTVWSFEDEDTWKQIIRDFEQSNKGFKLSYQKQTFDQNYENRFLNSVLAGQGPDIISMPNDWVYRHKDHLATMPSGTAKTTNLDSLFVPSIKQSVSFNGNTYALSPTSEPLMVYYNDRLFSDAEKKLDDSGLDKSEINNAKKLLGDGVPKTWTGFTEVANLLTEKDGDEILTSGAALGTDRISESQNILYLLMMQNGTKILSDNLQLATFNLPKDTAAGSNDSPGVRALDFYTSFANPDSENYTWNDSLGNNVDAFANGKVGMILGFSDLQSYFSQKYPNFRYRKAFIPQLAEDTTNIVDFAKFNAFGVSKFSKNTGVAWKLVSMLSTDSSSSFASATKLFTSKKPSSPSNTAVANRSSSNPEKISLETANSLVKGRYPIEFDKIIRDSIASVNSGVQDSRSSLDLAANNITELLRKESW